MRRSGLGKTIEAEVRKEYLLREWSRYSHLDSAPLVPNGNRRWRRNRHCVRQHDDPLFPSDSDRSGGVINRLIHTTKQQNFPAWRQFYDLVVVDEANHLKNRNTYWKLDNEIKKRFIFSSARLLQNH